LPGWRCICRLVGPGPWGNAPRGSPTITGLMSDEKCRADFEWGKKEFGRARGGRGGETSVGHPHTPGG